jgi:APA family basic amino acid/polyamine antiporter
VIILRYTRPELNRPFRCPFVPVIPLLCIIFCGVLVAALPTVTHLRFVIWLAVGLVIYFLYGIKSSRVNESTKDLECWNTAKK